MLEIRFVLRNVLAAPHLIFPACRIRDVIADYGPSLTIFAFTGFTLIPSFSSVNIVRINIPATFNTTSGRPWLVDFNDPDLSTTAKGLAFFPALVLTALYFFDHNVSALLTHRIKYSKSAKPMKPVCYDWDFMVLGFMMILCGALGLPPCNGLIPNSPMHSKALEVHKSDSHPRENLSRRRASAVGQLTQTAASPGRRVSLDGDAVTVVGRTVPVALPIVEFDYLVDQRVSNFLQSGLVAVMLAILPALALVPTSVVTGLFLFMGVESLLDGDIFSRLLFPFVQKEFLSFLQFDERMKNNDFLKNHQKQINVYTLVQLVAFGIVFYVTQTAASIAFPIFILLLIPLRFTILPKFKDVFDANFMDIIDYPLVYDGPTLVVDNQDQLQHSHGTGEGEMREKGMMQGAVATSAAAPCASPSPPDLLAAFHSPAPGLHHRASNGIV